MNERQMSEVAVWAPNAVLVLSLYLVVLAPRTAQAQEPIQRNPTLTKQAAGVVDFIAPQIVGVQAVAVQQINGVMLGFGELQVTEDLADADADQLPIAKQRVILFARTYDDLVYGNGSDAVDARTRLERRLQQKLEKIDRIIALTDAQKQKLHLAGRGDIKRLLDRTEKLRTLCSRSADVSDMNQFRMWILELKREVAALRHPLDAGPFDTDSLMEKCMKTMLTADQVSKFHRFEATPPYRPPERRPGRFEGAIELR
jgi:hypothetical protein